MKPKGSRERSKRESSPLEGRKSMPPKTFVERQLRTFGGIAVLGAGIGTGSLVLFALGVVMVAPALSLKTAAERGERSTAFDHPRGRRAA